ncbi:MAG: ATP-dependent helicase [archaeon]
MFLDKMKKKYGINFTKQQAEAILHIDGPTCVLSGPGSGKTTIMVLRTGYLILEKNVKPEKILSITFSKASANDMKKRFMKLFGDKIDSEVKFSTIHSFAFRIVREDAFKKGLNYKILEDYEQRQIIKEIYCKYYDPSTFSDERKDTLLNAIGYVKNMCMKPEKFYDETFEYFVSMYNDYDKFKQENNYVDFDDMLIKCYKLLRDDIKLLEEYRNLYDYIQLDEGQDTSFIQHQIVKLLVKPKNNFFLVADDDQSIYGFRGAFPEAILNFSKNYEGAEIIKMEENFRSSSNIVSLSNKFIKRNKLRMNKELYTNNKEHKNVELIKCDNDFQQVNYIINKLKKLDDYSKAAIIYAKNLSAVPYINALELEGIPFNLRANNYFFNHWIIKDFINFIDFAFSLNDVNKFELIYKKMEAFLPQKIIPYLKECGKNDYDKSVFINLIKYPGFQDFQIENIKRIAWDFELLKKKTPKQAIEFIENDLKYKKYLYKYAEETGFSTDMIDSVLHYLKIIVDEVASIEDIKERIEYLSNISISKQQDKGVTLITMHSSKGLEFDNVFLVDLYDGNIPSKQAIKSYYEEANPKEIEEERRLFYVAMTRAKNELYLLTPEYKFNSRVDQSKFVKEIDHLLHDDKPSAIFAKLNSSLGEKTPARYNKNTTKLVNHNNKKDSKESYKNLMDVSNKYCKIDKNNFKENTKIKHSEFGEGLIIKIQENIISVRFNNGKKRKLSLVQCIKKQAIEII